MRYRAHQHNSLGWKRRNLKCKIYQQERKMVMKIIKPIVFDDIGGAV
jgi:hypothetical protein